MPPGENSCAKTLILGVGNTLLSDDGFGVHAAESLRLRFNSGESKDIKICDGGTLGLSLLPDIEDADRLVIIDAGELHDKPGAMRVYFGDDVDRHLSQAKGTVHEVAVSDLLQAARFSGRHPTKRALIVVQPQSVDWGESPTPAVAAAIPKACDATLDIIETWRQL